MKIHPLADIILAVLLLILLAPVSGVAQNDLEAQFKSGAAALEKGNYDSAIQIFSAVIRADQNIPDAYRARAVAYFGNDKYDLAIADLQTAIKMYGNDANFKDEKGAALIVLGHSYLETGETAKAVSQFDAAVTLDPASDDAYYSRAKAQYAMGEYDKAVADQDKAFQLGSKLDRISFDRAMADLNREIYRNPDDPKAWYNRAMAYVSKFNKSTKPLFGRPTELTAAIADLDHAVKLNPKFAGALLQRGLVEEIDTSGMHIGPQEAALPFYDKAIEADPSLGEAYLRRGILLSKKLFAKDDEKAKAAADLAKALSLGVKNSEGLVALGDLSMGRLDFDQAIASYSAAIGLNPNEVKYYEQRADAYARKKDWAPAIQDRSKIIALKPDDTQALANRAEAYRDAGRYTDAVADWSTLIAKNPSGLHYSSRADSYVDLKDYPKAFADYSKAIELEPDDADHYLGRARAYRLSNDSANALADYRKAHDVDGTTPVIAADLSNAAAVDANRGNLGRIAARFSKSMSDLTDAQAKAEKAKDDVSKAFAAISSNLNETEDEKLARLSKAVDNGSAKAGDVTARGTIYFNKRNLDTALSDFNKALDLDAKQPDALFYRAMIRGTNGDFDAAISDLDRFIGLQPESAVGFFYRGKSYFGKKDIDRALVDYNKAISLSDANGDFFVKRGDVYYARNDYDKALADYDKAVSLGPKSAEAFYKRGNVRVMRKEYDGAIADYDKAIELAPDLTAAKNNRAVAVQQKGAK